MAVGFYHGVETYYKDTVPRPVTVVPSALIFLVGTAPTYQLETADVTLNDPVRCNSDLDDEQYFGSKVSGFTIPYALDAIRDQSGGSAVEVVNVFDAATHKTTATAISYTFTAASNSIQLQKVTGTAPSQTKVANTQAQGLTGTFTVTGTGGTPTHAINTDYTYNAETGVLTRVSGGGITSTGTVLVTYTYADPSKVTASEIVGAVVSGDRTGLQAALDVYPLRGAKPKIIIAPGWSDNATVAAELIVIAAKLDADCLIDAPVGATVSEAIAGRSGTAPVGVFNTASQYATLCYPRVKDADGNLQPFSQYLAGVIANTDRLFGYWYSPSNKDILGITGVEIRMDDEDVQDLNAAGIVTILNEFGTGFKTYGNRNALYPSDTTPLNFLCVRRSLAIFHESLRQASRPYVDQPIGDPLIDAIESAGNNFIYEQQALGALIEGSKLRYDKAKNPASALAAGKITFSITLMFPTPAENIIYESTLDIELLSGIGGDL